MVLGTLVLLAHPAGAADDEQRVVLTADDQYATETTWHGEGNVRIVYQEITIHCDAVDYDRNTGDLAASGHVIVDRGPSRFTADELRFNLESKTGIFTNVTAQIDPMYSFTGDFMEKLDDTHYRIDRATFTTCSTEGRPPWSFHVREAMLEEEGMGRFHGVAFKVQTVPIMYLPYMIFPLKQERTAGFLFPRLGYSDRRGFNLGLPYYIPLGRSYDTTVFADYYTGGYIGLGNQWRWAPVAGAEGQIDLYGIWNRTGDEFDTFQWQVFGFHQQEDFLGFRLLAQVENLSDIEFFRDFDRSFDANTRRSLYSYVYLTRSFGPYALNLRADHRQTFLTTADVTLIQLPEAELRSSSTPIFGSPVYLNLISSVNVFDVDRGGDLKGTYARADLFPQFSYTLPGPVWLSVTPRLGGRYTYYTSQYELDSRNRPTGFLEEGLDRLYFTGGVDVVGPSFSRIFPGGLGKYDKVKHLVEPRIEYRYLSTATDVSQIPIFDEVDSTPKDADYVTLILANRLLGRGGEGIGTRELGSFSIYQSYSLGDPLNLGDGVNTSQRGPLGMDLRMTPAVGTGFDARLAYDTLYRNLISSSLAASLQRPIGMLTLTWYQSRNPRTGERFSSQLRTLLGFRKTGFPLAATVNLAYDIQNSTLQDQRYRVEYQGSCWNVSAEYRDTKLGLYPTKEILILFGLKGVGALPEIKGSIGSY